MASHLTFHDKDEDRRNDKNSRRVNYFSKTVEDEIFKLGRVSNLTSGAGARRDWGSPTTTTKRDRISCCKLYPKYMKEITKSLA